LRDPVFRAAASEGRKLVGELRAFAAGGCGPPAFGRFFCRQAFFVGSPQPPPGGGLLRRLRLGRASAGSVLNGKSFDYESCIMNRAL